MKYSEARVHYKSLSAGGKERADWVSMAIWKNANVPGLYLSKTWEDWKSDLVPMEMCRDYVGDLDHNFENGIGLHFHGSYGTGKTMLACLVLKEAIRSFDHRKVPLYTGYFITFSELVDMFAGGWRDDLLKEKMEKMIRNVDFLVVDDLGKEFKAQKINLNQAALDSVLRHRVYEQLPIIITTNRSTNEIETDYGAGTMSLFREACKIINVTGKDYRQKIRDSR